MLTCLDTNGKVYISLVQSNTNTQIIKLFFDALVKMLDKEDKNWRKTTIVMMDNASWHVNDDALRAYSELNIPILFTGPQSYAASPIELLFAAFKKEDINPERVPTGKKYV